MMRLRTAGHWLWATILGGSMWIACSGKTITGGGEGGEGGSGGEPSSSSGNGGSDAPIGDVGKVDLLLMVDNSRGMADKQEVLAESIPDLVKALVNPRCVDPNGAPAAMQPAGPLDPCPVAGTAREFEPVSDIHIGIVSSSIGGHGADVCPNQESNSCAPNPNFTNNDKGHLVARADACGGSVAPTYQGKGFLAWDPKQVLMPPGEGNITSFTDALRDMTVGVGQVGCGYESQLESWYRFLADPEPYETIAVVDNKVSQMGVDTVLLAQRADFLRPNSLLAILMLTDEDDCSIKEFGQFFFAAQLKSANNTPFHLPPARVECATNPNDPCCLSCGQNEGNCPTDVSCFDGNMNVKALTDLEDPTNLRCFDQKRRFGIDFLYPIDRYTTALTSKQVPSRTGELVPNPIFSDLNPTDNNKVIRDSGLVFLAGIVGVPWQDIARKADDLSEGFKDADELEASNTWSVILGDPSTYVPPSDPHMIASISPRSGSNPITGDAIVPPGQGAVNPINGSEYSIPAKDDLQYACIFPLAAPRDCSDPTIVFCDCKDPSNDNPLCEPSPLDPSQRTMQTKAKAYPGLRHLSVLRALGSQGITASACPAQLMDPGLPDYGYVPAIRALVDRMKSRLITPAP